MKKARLFTLFLMLIAFSSFGQTVDRTSDASIKVNPQTVTESSRNNDLLQQQVTDFQLFSFDTKRLVGAVENVLAETTTFDLSFNFPSRTPWNLSVYPNDMRSNEYRAVAVTERGTVELDREPNYSYAGKDEQSRTTRLSISPDYVRGYVKMDGKLLCIEPLTTFIPDAAKDVYVLYESDELVLDPNMFCDVIDELGEEVEPEGSSRNNGTCCLSLALATDADFEYYQDYGSSTTAANNKILSDLNLVEGLYESQISLVFDITFQRVFTNNNDPYTLNGGTSTGTQIVTQVRDEWNNNMGGVNRDLVHMFSGKNHGGLFGSVGAGGIGVVCSNDLTSYGFTADRTNGFETTAHEIGHNFSGIHGDGTGCGSAGATTMCQGAEKDLNFSAASITRITNYINNNDACLENVCATQVTAYPYTESFESGLGLWTQATDDNMNWTRTSGGTPSTGTGPTSAYNGSWYMYTEATSNFNKTANLVSPCFKITGLTSPQFSFAYHMFGSNMGTLTVEVSRDCGATWNTLWARTGQQNDQATWNVAGVSLNAYRNERIQLRFRGNTGSSFRSDIAIDYVRIKQACSLTINAPYPSIFTPTGGTQNFTVSTSSSWTSSSSVPWLSASPAIGFSSISVTAQPNTTTSSRIGYIYLNCGGTIRSIFVVQTAQPPVPVTCNATINSFPYNESFESGIGLWTQATNDDFNWTRDASGTPSVGTGPSVASCGSYYMYTEATSNFNKTAYLVSPCFNLNGASDADFSFKYHMYGAAMGTLRLELSTNNGTSYSTIWTKSGQQTTTQGAGGWLTGSVSLSAYINQTIRLRFRGTTGTSYTSDMAIDCVNLATLQGCPDQYEPNNTYQVAAFAGYPGATNISVPDICLTSGDEDYFQFLNGSFASRYVRVRGSGGATGDYQLSIKTTNFTNFKRYTIETLSQNGSTTNTLLYLYSSNGTSQLAFNDNGGNGLFSKIIYDDYNYQNGDNDENDPQLREGNIGSNLALTNYPNPFTDNTVISFNLSEAHSVTLTIYDTHGKIIAQPIVKENRNEGIHTYEFDGSQLPDGVYMYSLQTEQQIVSKQMVIIR